MASATELKIGTYKDKFFLFRRAYPQLYETCFGDVYFHKDGLWRDCTINEHSEFTAFFNTKEELIERARQCGIQF